MTTAYTSLLGLALPVTGELSGTWGDTVNNSITSLLDSAIAGTQTITADTTLTTTTGAANQSRQAILLCSPASANITITAPAQSKIYTVINTSAVYTVTVRGVGPTTGVTLGVSEKAVVAWNGSDFIKISNTAGAGTFTNLTATGNVTLGDASADTVTVNGTTTFSASPIISVTDNTNAALRITQLGSGNALLVEDSANPDATPFVVDASGIVIQGYTSALTVTDYVGVSRTPRIQEAGLGGSFSQAYISSWSNSDTQAAGVIFGKSKSGTVGTAGAVTSGTDIGFIQFSGDDGTTMIPAALILAEVDGTPGTNDMPGRLVFSTTADGASTPTERVRITSAGKTGFATAAPAATVHVSGDTILSNVNVIGASYDSVSFSVTTEETVPTDLFFSPDGLKMYIIGVTGDDVNEYNLSTAWVVSSAVFVTSFSISSQETLPQGLFFRADGTKMYVIGTAVDTVFQYTLSTPWSVATASYDSISFSVAGQDLTPNGITFRPNGLSMYMVGGTNDSVYQYTLSTAWNVSTATFLQSFSVSGQETTPTGVTFTSDGSRMFVIGSVGDDVNVYNLTTPWDISTSVFVNVFSVSAQDTAPAGIYIKPDGTKMYIMGQGNDTVYQYTVPSIDIQLTGPTSAAALDVQQDLTVYGNTRAYKISASSVATFSAGTVALPAITTTGDTNTGIFFPAADTIAFTKGGVESMRIDSSGNVGIGTLPSARLDVSGNAIISVTDNTNAALRITQLGTGNALLVEDSTNPDASPFVIDASGNIVAGYTAPIATVSFGGGAITPLLQVQGTGLSSSSAGVSNWSGTAASASSFVFSKSNSGTIGTRGAVASATNLGSVNFAGDDGTNFIASASIAAAVDGTPGTNDMPGRLVFSTTADGSDTPTERMRINSSGNVGIGTTSPSANLEISNAGDAGLRITAGNTSRSIIQLGDTDDGNVGEITYSHSTNSMAFDTNDVERMRIDSSGNVGIGTSSPTAVLMLKAGTATASTSPLKFTSGTNLTTAEAGSVEYDGNVFYGTADVTSGRGLWPTTQYFRLTADGTAIGPTIANFFGSTSGKSLDTSTFYEVEYNLYFTKTTAGTVTFTLTYANAPINCNADYVGTPVGGVGTVGAPQTAALVKSTATASALPVTGSLTTGVNHQYVVKAIFQANATTGGTLNLQVTSSAGTVTPLTGSYYKATRLPAANTGAFV